MKAELKCVMCVAEVEQAKAAGQEEPKVGSAYVVYQGSTMCRRHMFAMVKAQMKQQQNRIAVPQVGKVKLT